MSQLSNIQRDIHGRLVQDEYFADVLVLLADPKDEQEAAALEASIEEQLFGQASNEFGAGVVVVVPRVGADVPNADLPGPRLMAVPQVRVFEDDAANMGPTGAGKPSEEVALQVLNVLHHFYLQNLGTTLLADDQAIEPTQENGRNGQNVFLRIEIGLQPPTKVALPVVSGTASAVTISCATEGATVRYTTDGSYPHARNAAAERYTAAFTVTSGSTVRAVATKDGLQASNLGAAIIS